MGPEGCIYFPNIALDSCIYTINRNPILKIFIYALSMNFMFKSCIYALNMSSVPNIYIG